MSVPLAVAVGQSHQVGGVGIVVVVITEAAGVISCVTGQSRRAPQRFGGRAAQDAR